MIEATRGFIATQAATDAFAAMDQVRAARQVGLTISPPGQGKSTLLAAYSDRVNGARTAGTAVLCWRAAVVNTPRELVLSLLQGLGVGWNGGTNAGDVLLRQRMLERAVEAVIVDDAQRLARHTLDMLRALHETTGVALILCGTPRLQPLLEARCAELSHRVTAVHRVTTFELHDVLALMNAAGLARRHRGAWSCAALARALLYGSGGNPRLAAMVLARARSMARKEHRTVSVRTVVRAVAAMRHAV